MVHETGSFKTKFTEICDLGLSLCAPSANWLCPKERTRVNPKENRCKQNSVKEQSGFWHQQLCLMGPLARSLLIGFVPGKILVVREGLLVWLL